MNRALERWIHDASQLVQPRIAKHDVAGLELLGVQELIRPTPEQDHVETWDALGGRFGLLVVWYDPLQVPAESAKYPSGCALAVVFSRLLRRKRDYGRWSRPHLLAHRALLRTEINLHFADLSVLGAKELGVAERRSIYRLKLVENEDLIALLKEFLNADRLGLLVVRPASLEIRRAVDVVVPWACKSKVFADARFKQSAILSFVRMIVIVDNLGQRLWCFHDGLPKESMITNTAKAVAQLTGKERWLFERGAIGCNASHL